LTTAISIVFFLLGVRWWSEGKLSAGDFVLMEAELMLVFNRCGTWALVPQDLRSRVRCFGNGGDHAGADDIRDKRHAKRST